MASPQRTTKHYLSDRRWGRVAELDKRVRVGTAKFFAQPIRLQQLQAWRAMHTYGGHMPVRMYGTRLGVRPSSDLTIKKKEAFVKKYVQGKGE